jgi:hypothetical protein
MAVTVVSQINGIDNRKHEICGDDFALRHPKSDAKSVRWHVTPSSTRRLSPQNVVK